MTYRQRHLLLGPALTLAVASRSLAAGGDVVSSNPNPLDPVDGLNLATFLGADRFHSAGFNGSAAIVASIESGLIWNGHESLTHATTQIIGPGALGEYDRHGTWVGAVIGGRPTAPGNIHQTGLAFGATLWSGAIATVWVGTPYRRSFDFTVNSFAQVYKTALITGVNGQTADVVNSSWSDSSDPEAARWGDYSRAIDAIAAQSGKTLVFTAGNSGSVGMVGTPGAGYNVITVGALGNDLTVPAYESVSSFSSRGPQPIYVPAVRNADYFNPAHGTSIPAARAAVDLVAPGESIVSALYGGTTGGNSGGTDIPGNNLYSSSLSGTSFAAPMVAAGATLMADAARQTFGPATKALDGRVMKANLLNSADKISGWNNAQSTDLAGVVRTTQALDYAAGAGRLNLSRAYDQLLSGTADVAGTGGGVIQPLGWDFGVVAQGAPNDYLFTQTLDAGARLTVTLDWFIDREIDLATNATLETSYDNLTLQVFSGTPATGALVAESVSPYNEVEHLYFTLPASGAYSLRVSWAGEVWDLVNDANQAIYGLAWSVVAVPEPTALFGMMLLARLGAPRRR